MRINLNDTGTQQLAGTVKKRCDGIPKAWPEKDLTQAEVEGLVSRDRQDSSSCAKSAVSYVHHIETRDAALMKKVK